MLVGGIGTVIVGHDYVPQRRRIDAAEAAVAHVLAEPALPPPLQKTLQEHEAEIEQWQSSGVRTAMPVTVAVLGVGIFFLVLALAFALIAGRGRDSPSARR